MSQMLLFFVAVVLSHSTLGEGAVTPSFLKDDDYPNCTTDNLPKQSQYQVVVTELDAVGNHGASLISQVNQSSDFEFNFNAAWFPAAPSLSSSKTAPRQEGLIVRLVDFQRHPEWVNAGALAAVPVMLGEKPPLTAEHVTEQLVTWAGTSGPLSYQVHWGAADPRITYRAANQQYYLTWDNCTKNCGQRITVLSTSDNPLDPHSWTFHGAVFPFPYTSGAALLFRDDDNNNNNNNNNNLSNDNHNNQQPPHLAFVCNSNSADTLFVVESYNGLNWTIPSDPNRRVLMKGRPGCWDHRGVAAGPQPERLSTGDYLLIYNIDTGWPYHPNPLGRCAIGWAILDGDDPTKIVARSNEPLLIATRPWETCEPLRNETICQVPMVVFACGLKPIIRQDNNHNTGNDATAAMTSHEFYVIYGAADSVIGVSRIKVNIFHDATTTTTTTSI